MLKYHISKGFFVIVFLIAQTTLFSQISFQDSLNYFEDLKGNSLLGVDIRGKRMPAFKAKDTNGRVITNDSLFSKVTFINFWFEACAPCVAEFHALEKFYKENKPGKDFQFISITFEQDSIIERVRQKNNLTFPIYRLSYDSCKKIKFNLGYPTNLIIDRSGKIVFSLTGGSIDPVYADKSLNYFIQAELERQLYPRIPGDKN